MEIKSLDNADKKDKNLDFFVENLVMEQVVKYLNTKALCRVAQVCK